MLITSSQVPTTTTAPLAGGSLHVVVTYLPFAVEAQDLKANAGRPPRLNLVQVPEEVETCPPSAVVQLTLRQHAQEGGLSRVHVSQHCHAQVQELRTHTTRDVSVALGHTFAGRREENPPAGRPAPS